ncbi:hypothetical protein BJX99DRAFT_255636 [Aspergillus californicus]
MASTGNERFNDEAAHWDKNIAVQEATRLAFDALKPIIQTLSDDKKKFSGSGLNVLEVGCGTGLLTLRVAPLVNEIVATDPAHGMIEMLKAKTRAINAEEGKQTIRILPVCRVALTDFEDFGPEAIKFHLPTKLVGVERHGIPAKWIKNIMKEVGFQDVKIAVGWTLIKPIDAWENNNPGDTQGFPFLVCEGVRP